MGGAQTIRGGGATPQAKRRTGPRTRKKQSIAPAIVSGKSSMAEKKRKFTKQNREKDGHRGD